MKTYLILTLLENNRSAIGSGYQATEGLVLKQPLILPFLYHKSAAKYQIDLNKVSYSKLKPDLCNSVKTEIIESRPPPQ